LDPALHVGIVLQDGMRGTEEVVMDVLSNATNVPFIGGSLGVVLSTGEPFVRSPQQVRGTDVVFYCSVKNGMRLHVLKARNIVDDTRRDLERTLAGMGTCSGIINFHCILRTAELVAKGQCEAYGALFTQCPTIGFSTYGESYVGHINQTATLLLFG
jgi:hypothetical protein